MDSLDLAMELDERDREVIADSEDESLGHTANAPKLASISDISSFTNQRLTIKLPTISSFTNSENLEDTSKITAFETDFSTGLLSIADRAKTRQRRNKVRVFDPIDDASSSIYPNNNPFDRSDNIIELTDDEDELALPPPKPRPKPKPRAKPQPNVNLDISNVATPDTIISKPRPKPKPKPVTKATSDIQSPHTDTPTSIMPKPRPKPRPIPKKVPPPCSPNSISQDSLPRHVSPSSSLAAPIPFHLISSQLPPSDPPPTSTPDDDIPRIETLPNTGTDFDIPTSSPASLFGTTKSPGRPGHRKRTSNAIDELDSDDAPGQMVDRRMMPPPPTFFASSSSIVSEGARPEVLPNAEVVDLTTLPVTIDPSASSSKKVAKPRKPRKKKGESDADGGEKAKGKPKPKPKARKNQVEVVITLPPSNAKPAAKRKGKEVEGAFKSKEFIDDDEDDMQVATNTTMPGIIGATTSAKPDSTTSLSSILSSEDDGGVIKLVPKKRKAILDDPADQAVDTSAALDKKVKSKGKERAIPEERTEAPPPTKKTSAGAKGKGRTIVSSEDEDEDNLPEEDRPSPTRTRGQDKRGKRKRGKNNVTDDDDRDTIHNQQIDDQDPNEAAKENVVLQPKPNVETPAKDVLFPTLASRYTLAPKTKATPMSELIRRVNSLPGSPFISPAPRATMNRQASAAGTAYSPYLKSSRALLSRIAPLHPNRRTPPPPLPPPPPRKKTKKELEMEERWEEELVESVGGVTEWACMTDEERRDLRRAKREREMCGWDD